MSNGPVSGGRRLVRAADGEVVVASWHAPLVVRWMLTTLSEPDGVLLCRRLTCHGPVVHRYYDELVVPRSGREDDQAVPAVADEPPAQRIDRLRDYLLEDLERARDGRMRDIVETIQREQLMLVSDRRDGVLVVQGGPGTGKTAVGLHRVSWLAYNNVFRRGEMLVVGPHRGFLEHVGQVLPRLGTSGVTLVERNRLWDKPAGVDPLPARLVKSSARMAAVLRRGIEEQGGTRALQRHLKDGAFGFVFEGSFLSVPQADIEKFYTWESGAYAAQRLAFGNRLVDTLTAAHREADPTRHNSGVRKRIERHPQVKRIVNAVRPRFSAEQVLRDLLTDAEFLRRAADGVLEEAEQAAILRERRERMADEPWSLEDQVCLEELRYLLSGDGPPRYRHLVVDEAQDLTPMQARSLARRCPSGSMTILGDLAQAAGLHRWSDWSRLTGVLSAKDGWHLEQLTIGYRVPREVMDFAAPLARTLAPHVPFPESVRPGGEGTVTLQRTTEDSVAGEAVARAAGRSHDGRSVAIVVPHGMSEIVSDQATVLHADDCRGLEFDHVVLVEPAAMAAHEPGGLGSLYVALTRCTQSLTIVHSAPLPRELNPTAEPMQEDNPMTTTGTESRSQSGFQAFINDLESAVRTERGCHVHESIRYSLAAQLHASQLTPVATSPTADLVCEGPAGRVLYEVLGEGGHTYPAIRQAVLRIMEVQHAEGDAADHHFVVLPCEPEQPWAADVLRDAFDISLIWRSGADWGGDRVDLALGREKR